MTEEVRTSETSVYVIETAGSIFQKGVMFINVLFVFCNEHSSMLEYNIMEKDVCENF
jgi:hypothetical protein